MPPVGAVTWTWIAVQKLREWMDENYLVVTAIVLGVVKPYRCVAEPPQNYCVALTSVVVCKI